MRPPGRASPGRPGPLARAALGLAAAGLVCWAAAVALYQEPRSFYTNFVLVPSLVLAATGTALDLAAAAAALGALRRPPRRPALLALGVALAAPLLGMAVIQLALRR